MRLYRITGCTLRIDSGWLCPSFSNGSTMADKNSSVSFAFVEQRAGRQKKMGAGIACCSIFNPTEISIVVCTGGASHLAAKESIQNWRLHVDR